MPAINMVVVTQSARSGLMVENITPQLGEFFGVKNGNGVLIRAVDKGSRAEKAGFRAGDVIVKINDQPVHDTSDFTHAVRARNGNSVSVGVMRDKKEQNLKLPLPDAQRFRRSFRAGEFRRGAAHSGGIGTGIEQAEWRIGRNCGRRWNWQRKTPARRLRETCAKNCDGSKREFLHQSEKQRKQIRKKDMENLRQQLSHMRGDWL